MPAASEWGTPDFSLSRGGRVGHQFRDLDGSGPLSARPAPQPPCPEPWHYSWSYRRVSLARMLRACFSNDVWAWPSFLCWAGPNGGLRSCDAEGLPALGCDAALGVRGLEDGECHLQAPQARGKDF